MNYSTYGTGNETSKPYMCAHTLRRYYLLRQMEIEPGTGLPVSPEGNDGARNLASLAIMNGTVPS